MSNVRLSEKVGHAPLSEIRPAPENDDLYGQIVSDESTQALAESIRRHGIVEAIVISNDNFIISGHRRYFAARMHLTTVPCRRADVSRKDQPEEFLRLLREANRQRVKNHAQIAKETILDMNPDQAYSEIQSYRTERSRVDVETVELRGRQVRKRISEAKFEFLNAVIKVINDLREYWPVSDRQVHYGLLNNPPLKHSAKADSRYRNDYTSYKSLVDLLSRARHEGRIPYEAIADTTRAVSLWNTDANHGRNLGKNLPALFKGYWRDLMQSQASHIEIVAEKLTLQSIIRPVAMRYTIPLTIGRGYCSTWPVYDIMRRFVRSGKDQLVILSMSDMDPDGEEITHSLARRLRDDHDIDEDILLPVKVALTYNQVIELELPPNMESAKQSSANYGRYVTQHGTEDVWELEALQPDDLEELLDEAIQGVLDIDAYNDEVGKEHEDIAYLAKCRNAAMSAIQGMD